MPNAVPGVATFVFAQDPACEDEWESGGNEKLKSDGGR